MSAPKVKTLGVTKEEEEEGEEDDDDDDDFWSNSRAWERRVGRALAQASMAAFKMRTFIMGEEATEEAEEEA